MKVIWKSIKGYEDFYEVSNQGIVRSLNMSDSLGRYHEGRIISTKLNNRGYTQVHLNLKGITQMKLVHRLVAEAFIENPNNLAQVNHKDENKSNNDLDNLEWCSNLYNRHYGDSIKRMSTNRDYDKTKLNAYKPIVQIDKVGGIIKTWPCIAQAKRETGINDTSISFCCRGKQKTAGGYIWQYAL